LNDLSSEDGGQTHFPLYNIKFSPLKGTILYFDNLFYNNVGNSLTIHESMPILTDKIKYVLTTWSRITPRSDN